VQDEELARNHDRVLALNSVNTCRN
jgi:hypothetical protein